VRVCVCVCMYFRERTTNVSVEWVGEGEREEQKMLQKGVRKRKGRRKRADGRGDVCVYVSCVWSGKEGGRKEYCRTGSHIYCRTVDIQRPGKEFIDF
jgi:hypothetical protein